MSETEVIAIVVQTIRAGTPLVFAAIGELIVEKAGVLNLGIEGMMLVGAVFGFIDGGADDEVAAPEPAPAVDPAELARVVREAVSESAPQAVSAEEINQMVQDAILQAAPRGVSADEINRMVQAAITAAAPETASPEEIQQMVRDAVAAAAQPGATKEEIESLVANAVSESVAGIQPGVTASEVQKLVSDALQAVPTPATITIVEQVDPRFAGVLRTTNIQMNSIDPLSTSGLAAGGIARHSQESPFAFDTVGQPHPVLCGKPHPHGFTGRRFTLHGRTVPFGRVCFSLYSDSEQ